MPPAAITPPSHLSARIGWRRSIRTRLALAAGLLVLAGLTAVGGVLGWTAFDRTVSATQDRLSGTVSVLSVAVSEPLALSQPDRVRRALTAIGDIGEVQFAAVVDDRDRTIASVGTGTFLAQEATDMGDITAVRLLTQARFWIEAPVVHAGSRAGRIYALADLSPLRADFLRTLLLSLVMAIAISVAAGLVVFIVVRRMTAPLGHLAALMARLAADGRYDRRAAVDRADEVGALASAFNAMLTQIQRRDRALQDYRDHLEDKVDTRTAELKQAMIAAEAANRAKSDFLATMSHEIRTPMNGMLVMAEMLSGAALSPRHQRYAQIIHRSGRGLLAIINDILDLSKIEAGSVELETIPFSVDTLVDDTISLFAERAREKGLELSAIVAPGVARRLAGDPTRIGQIVTNLVNNGLKFTSEGGVSIRVEVVGGVIDGRQAVRIAVVDTGIGIAADKLATIFEAFSQAEQSTAREYGGTGLGLAICKRLAAAMDGDLSVESTPGAGSRFVFEAAFEVVEAADEPACLAGRPVAVVSDCALLAADAASALAAHGATIVDPSASGEPAPLVLLDEAAAGGLPPDRAAAGPVVRLSRGGASTAAPMPGSVAWRGTLPWPLTRAAIADLGLCLADGDWARLERARTPLEAPAALPRFTGIAVLAVDDNAVNREVLNEALMALGVQADFAESGPQAIERAAAVRYDVIFMDCSMPGMDGFEASERIRRAETEAGEPPAFIAALTAHVSGTDADRFARAGMDAHVTKPFAVADIAAILQTRHEGADKAGAPGTPADDGRDVDGSGAQDESDEAPLLAGPTLAMFETLGSANGAQMAGRVFGLFALHAGEGFDRLAAAVSEGAPPETLAEHAHALKSMCASAGAERARLACQGIEDDAHAGRPIAPGRLDALAATIAATREAMDAYVGDGEADATADVASS